MMLARRVVGIVVGSLAVTLYVACTSARAALPLSSEPAHDRAIPNDNRVSGGRLSGGVFTLNLEARAADWYPEDSTGPAVPVFAFAESGKAAMVPAPMIRVPVGTIVRVNVRNVLDRLVTVRGLQQRADAVPDSMLIAPGATRSAEFVADVPGTFFYWGRTEKVPADGRPGRSRDASLFGAFIIDPADVAPREDERILVITMWEDTSARLGIKSEYADAVLRREMVPRNAWLLFGVNGRSWPYTERLTYSEGDTVRWRVINGAQFPHPMHLHGFHFQVEARGGALRDTLYTPAQRRIVVTERLGPGESMRMTWHAERPGNWLFHCHFVTHVSDANAPRTRGAHTAHGNHAEEAMAGLVMGIYVKPVAAAQSPEPSPRRRLRLFITARPDVFGSLPAYSYILQEGATPPARDSVRGMGSTHTLRQHEPTEISVHNVTREATSIHWHGIELESFYDGVGDWSGWGSRVAPMIAPGDSFLVRLTPPRAGTFIYHTHAGEGLTLASGLYGPLIVLPADASQDPPGDIVLISAGGPHDSAPPFVNGSTRPAPIVMRAGVPHRLRLINIDPLYTPLIELRLGDSLQTWRLVAKDGAEKPPHQAVVLPASNRVNPGETYDFEVLRAHADTLTLIVISPATVADRVAARARGVPDAEVPRIITRIPLIVR